MCYAQGDFGEEFIFNYCGFLVEEGFLVKGQVKREDAQVISFAARVGGKYRVEMVHGEYLYFTDFIEPKSVAPMSSTILLIEAGEKVRVQKIRESEGG